MTDFLRIGGFTLAVECRDEALACRIEEPMARFAVDPAPADVTIEVAPLADYAPPAGALLFDSGEVWRMFGDDDAVVIECRSEVFGETPYKVARFTEDFTRGEVRLRIAGANPLEYPLDELLANALLARRGGVELHACGIVDRDGAGYVFAGSSGAGKTTTARLWSGEHVDVVSDDRVIVRREHGDWRMYGTPWHGEAEICSPTVAPLRHVFLLDKADAHAVRPLAPAEAVARLLACAFPPFHDADGIGSVTATLAALATGVPVSLLSFANDASTVDFVRRVARKEAA